VVPYVPTVARQSGFDISVLIIAQVFGNAIGHVGDLFGDFEGILGFIRYSCLVGPLETCVNNGNATEAYSSKLS
jgi:hypothetical protein